MRNEKRLSPQRKPKVNPTIVLREEFEGQAFLFDPDTGHTYNLNPAGAFIWKHLSGENSIDQIVKILDKVFDTDSSPVIEDLNTFLNDLKDKGFIE